MPERDHRAQAAPRPARRRRNPVAAFFVTVGRALAVILTTVLIVAVFLAAVCAVMTHGPSDAAKRLFVNSMDETSALKFVPRLFLPEDEVGALNTEKIFEQLAESEGIQVLGWREVPCHPAQLGAGARRTMPCIRQCFLKRPKETDAGQDFDRRLYILRRVFEHGRVCMLPVQPHDRLQGHDAGEPAALLL